MPTLALGLLSSNHLEQLQERQQMKIVLGATLILIGIIQIADWIHTIPALGYPLAIALVGIWLYEINKEIQARRR